MLTDDEIDAVYLQCQRYGGDIDVTKFARAIIAAYQAKLRQGVELPEETATVPDCDFLGTPIVRTCKPVQMGDKLYSADQLIALREASIQAGYMRGLEECLEICNRLTDKNMHSADCAAAIEKLKGGE